MRQQFAIFGFSSEWKAVSWCTNISRTYCDLTKELSTYLTYDIEVRIIKNQGMERRLEQITFTGELDSKLLLNLRCKSFCPIYFSTGFNEFRIR